jgi:hypothetical protein
MNEYKIFIMYNLNIYFKRNKIKKFKYFTLIYITYVLKLTIINFENCYEYSFNITKVILIIKTIHNGISNDEKYI